MAQRVKALGKVLVLEERCKECGICIEFCPEDALVVAERTNAKGYHPVQQTPDDRCNGCGICGRICPDAALEVFRV